MAGHPLIYDAFGQLIASDRSLPWAPAPPPPPDHQPSVWLHTSPAPLADLPGALPIHRFVPPPTSPERPLQILHNPDDSLDIIDPAGRLRVSPSSHHILADWPPSPQSTAWLTSALEHIALPLIWLREPQAHTSRTILHGSAVVVDQKAWVFLGTSGAGKSTTVRSLTQTLARLLTDDLALIQNTPNGGIVWPGSGAVRLWDGFEHLTPATSFELLNDGERVKRWLRFPNPQREPSPQPLGGIVCLERTHDAPPTGTLIPVQSPQRAALLLLAQALALSSPPLPWQRERFEAVCALARAAKVWRLLYRASDSGAPLHLEALGTLWAHK